jgi:hypothetical protein
MEDHWITNLLREEPGALHQAPGTWYLVNGSRYLVPDTRRQVPRTKHLVCLTIMISPSVGWLLWGATCPGGPQGDTASPGMLNNYDLTKCWVTFMGSHLPRGTTGRHCLQGDHRETERKDGNPLTHSIQYIQIKQAKTHCSTVTPCLTSISPLSSQIFHKNASTPTFDFVKKHNTTKTNR